MDYKNATTSRSYPFYRRWEISGNSMVCNSTHEYDIINSIGYKADKYVFVEPNYDFIEVSENPDKTEGFYFNVSRMLKEYERKYKEN